MFDTNSANCGRRIHSLIVVWSRSQSTAVRFWLYPHAMYSATRSSVSEGVHGLVAV